MSEPLPYDLDLVKAPALLSLETNPPETESLIYVSLRHRGLLSIRFGEEVERYRLLSRDPRAPWCVARLEKDRLSANFQGNPLWPHRVLRDFPNLCDHFALSHAFNDAACILPLTAEINDRLDLLLGRTLRTSPKRFGFQDASHYSATGGDLIPAQDYVDAFIDSGKLPMADVGERSSVHDWSYHFVTFLFEAFLENVRLNLELIRRNLGRFPGVTCYAWNYYGHTLDQGGKMKGHTVREELSHRAAVYRQMAVSLDVATAKLVQLLCLQQAGHGDRCRSEWEACEVFAGGVRREAIRNLLELEAPESLSFEVPSGMGASLGPSLLDHCTTRLTHLELVAGAIADRDQISRRQQVFAEVLRALGQGRIAET